MDRRGHPVPIRPDDRPVLSTPPASIASRRRRIRKGTRSCWECKHRKVRCEFSSPTAPVCVGCAQRSSRCVGQDVPEDSPVLAAEQSLRLEHGNVQLVEKIVRDVLRSVGTPVSGSSTIHVASDGQDASHTSRAVSSAGILTPGVSTRRRPSDGSSPEDALAPDSTPDLVASTTSPEQSHNGSNRLETTDKLQSLSRKLHAILPPPNVVQAICNAGSLVSVFLVHHMRTRRLHTEQTAQNTFRKLLDVPPSTAHPVILARYMLTMATLLQYLHPNSHQAIEDLSAEPPHILMRRLASTASSLVTSQDELLGSVESLECVILEATFQANIGDLRRSWLSFRRAIGLAQLMGISKTSGRQSLTLLEPKSTSIDTRVIWFRLVYVDRFLCLMQGLPPATGDAQGWETIEGMLPMDRLEHSHCAVAWHVLRRNEQGPGGQADCAVTQEIERELQKAAQLVPARWWLTPNLAAADQDAVFGETLRLVNQMFHYNLLNQLHLPTMLRGDDRRHPASGDSSSPWLDAQQYSYAKSTCVSASREMLARFIAFRSFNRIAFCCRSTDFFALMASLTLLIAYLDSHLAHNEPIESGGLPAAPAMLANQRIGDVAMMEEVLENMCHIGRLNADPVSQKNADLLRWLLAMEADAAGGRVYYVERLSAQVAQGSNEDEEDSLGQTEEQHQSLRINIAYFGLLRIRRGGLASSRRVGQPLFHEEQAATQCQSSVPRGVGHGNQGAILYHQGQSDIALVSSATKDASLVASRQGQQLDASASVPVPLPVSQMLAPPCDSVFDDWELQGFDDGFCNNVLRASTSSGFGSGDDSHGWQNWPLGPPI